MQRCRPGTASRKPAFGSHKRPLTAQSSMRKIIEVISSTLNRASETQQTKQVQKMPVKKHLYRHLETAKLKARMASIQVNQTCPFIQISTPKIIEQMPFSSKKINEREDSFEKYFKEEKKKEIKSKLTKKAFNQVKKVQKKQEQMKISKWDYETEDDKFQKYFYQKMLP